MAFSDRDTKVKEISNSLELHNLMDAEFATDLDSSDVKVLVPHDVGIQRTESGHIQMSQLLHDFAPVPLKSAAEKDGQQIAQAPEAQHFPHGTPSELNTRAQATNGLDVHIEMERFHEGRNEETEQETQAQKEVCSPTAHQTYKPTNSAGLDGFKDCLAVPSSLSPTKSPQRNSHMHGRKSATEEGISSQFIPRGLARKHLAASTRKQIKARQRFRGFSAPQRLQTVVHNRTLNQKERSKSTEARSRLHGEVIRSAQFFKVSEEVMVPQTAGLKTGRSFQSIDPFLEDKSALPVGESRQQPSSSPELPTPIIWPKFSHIST